LASNRLPNIGTDSGTWGAVLNSFLSYSLVSNYTSGGTTTLTAQSGALSYVSIITASTYTIGYTGNGGATSGNETVLANAASNAITITLPSAVSFPGIIHTIKKVDSTANIVSIASVSNQTIDGTNATSSPIQIKVQYVTLSLASDGSNWYII
jgi:hypothetical protein